MITFCRSVRYMKAATQQCYKVKKHQ